METRDSEDLEKPKNKSMSDSWEIEEPAKVEPELLIEEEKAPHADQIQDKEPQYRIPIQRNSIFNRTVKHRSKGKAGDTSEPNTSHLADSLENGRSAQEPVTLNLPQSGTQTEPGAKRTRSLYQALAATKQKKPVVGKKAAATKKPAAEKKPAEGRAATEEKKPAA